MDKVSWLEVCDQESVATLETKSRQTETSGDGPELEEMSCIGAKGTQ